jgi:Ras-related protein Rab-2A
MTTKLEDLTHEVLSEEFSEYDLSFKIIVVGDSGVGKSCLTMQGTKNHFEDCYTPTVGFEFFTFNIRINDKNIKLQIWDTCGQEAYRSLITSFYRNASLAILVYSIDNQNSYNNIEAWLNEIKSQANPETKTFLIGNKVDLESQRTIPKEIAQQFCKEHGFNYFEETSAKEGTNAQKVFINAAKELYLTHLQYKDRASRFGSLEPNSYQPNANINNNLILEDDDEKPRKKKSCC